MGVFRAGHSETVSWKRRPSVIRGNQLSEELRGEYLRLRGHTGRGPREGIRMESGVKGQEEVTTGRFGGSTEGGVVVVGEKTSEIHRGEVT